MEPVFHESWLHQILRDKFREDSGYRQFTRRDNLSHITRADIDTYHLFQLKKTMAYACEKSIFYRDLFRENGINVEDIRSLEDIARIPCTQPADIARNPFHFACVPLGDIGRITTFTSSGTIGPQKRVFFTDSDLEIITDFMAAGMRSVADEGDIVQILLPSGRPNDQADLLAQGVQKMGGIPVITGITPSTDDQIKAIYKYHSTVLFGPAFYIWRITQEARQRYDLKTKGVKTLFVTSEFLSESMRKHMREIWNCDVHVHYGLTEMGLGVAVECHAHDGYHYDEADMLAEIIDPHTGAVLEEDEEGELVFTCLNRQAMPLIRYRTHDISKLVSSHCRCGAYTLKKIAPVTRRTESIVKVGDNELYPAAFDDLLYSFPDVIDYQMTLYQEGNKDILNIKIEVVKEDDTTRELITNRILTHVLVRKNLANNLLSLAPIEFVNRGSFERLNRAKKLIFDKRTS